LNTSECGLSDHWKSVMTALLVVHQQVADCYEDSEEDKKGDFEVGRN
jgi:hypothetical protein